MRCGRAVVAWSGGKDAAWAMHLARQEGWDVVAALTMVNDDGAVATHRVPAAALAAQVAALGLPCVQVRLPVPCPNDVYERAMDGALAGLRAEGVTACIFGDLFLADIRAYREAQMARLGIAPVFPLWERPTGALARDMLGGGLAARLVCVDTTRLKAGFAGRAFDAALLADLPPGVDPCGERGEFHTFVTAGPMLARPIDVTIGATRDEGRFVYAPPRL